MVLRFFDVANTSSKPSAIAVLDGLPPKEGDIICYDREPNIGQPDEQWRVLQVKQKLTQVYNLQIRQSAEITIAKI